jgi:hypothetical protein
VLPSFRSRRSAWRVHISPRGAGPPSKGSLCAVMLVPKMLGEMLVLVNFFLLGSACNLAH